LGSRVPAPHALSQKSGNLDPRKGIGSEKNPK
jgi:hypothetical protein